jgi:hypothetical protein
MPNRVADCLGILVCLAGLIGVGVMALSDYGKRGYEPTLPLVDYVAQVRETRGPVSYFVNYCMRCHNSPDVAYMEFANPRRDDELRRMILLMATTLAMSPSDPQTLQGQYDLHLAMLDRDPYVWLDSEDNPASDIIVGERIEPTEVYLLTATTRLRAATDQHRFVLPNVPGTIEAVRGDKRVTIPRDASIRQSQPQHTAGDDLGVSQFE